MEQREAARRVVLFDFDGVLIRGDAFSLFMRDRYARARWRTALVLLSSPWLLLVLPFSRRRVVRTLVHLGLLGVDEARYQTLVQAFAATLVRHRVIAAATACARCAGTRRPATGSSS